MGQEGSGERDVLKQRMKKGDRERGRQGGREACCVAAASVGFSEGHVYGLRVWPSCF